MDYAALIGMLSQTGGALAGQAMSAQDRATMLRLLKEQQAKYAGIEDPRFQDVAPDIYGRSALEDIQADPALAAQQQGVDQSLKDVVDSGGRTLQDKAAQADIYDKLARHTAAGNASIRNNAAARGALNSGSSLALQLANQQAGTQQAAESARDLSGNAQMNALKALQQRYSNASQMDESQYRRKSAAAAAADAINQHNASARMNAAKYANGQQQQQFSNRFSKVSGQQGATDTLANYYGTEADSKQATGNAIGNAGAAYAYSQRRQPKRSSYQSAPVDEYGTEQEDDERNY